MKIFQIVALLLCLVTTSYGQTLKGVQYDSATREIVPSGLKLSASSLVVPMTNTVSSNLSFQMPEQFQTVSANRAYVLTNHQSGAKLHLVLTNTGAFSIGFNRDSGSNSIHWINGPPRGGTNGIYDFVFFQTPTNVVADFVQTFYTSKGDLYASDGTNKSSLSVGADGAVLSADSSQLLGIKWIPSFRNFATTNTDPVLRDIVNQLITNQTSFVSNGIIIWVNQGFSAYGAAILSEVSSQYVPLSSAGNWNFGSADTLGESIYSFDTGGNSVSNAYLFRVRNNGTNRFTIEECGRLSLNDTQAVFDPSVLNTNEVVAYFFDTSSVLDANAAALAAFRNNGTNRFVFFANGNLWFPRNNGGLFFGDTNSFDWQEGQRPGQFEGVFSDYKLYSLNMVTNQADTTTSIIEMWDFSKTNSQHYAYNRIKSSQAASGTSINYSSDRNDSSTNRSSYRMLLGTSQDYLRVQRISAPAAGLSEFRVILSQNGGIVAGTAPLIYAQVSPEFSGKPLLELASTNTNTVVLVSNDGTMALAKPVYLTNGVIFTATNGNHVGLAAAKSNALPVTNFVGVVQMSAATALFFDASGCGEWAVTNRLGANTIAVVTNTVAGKSLTGTVIGEISGGTSRTFTLQPDAGHLVANLDDLAAPLATSFTVTVTNGYALEWSDEIRKLNGTNVHKIATRQFKF
jgi:hypothetical protein